MHRLHVPARNNRAPSGMRRCHFCGHVYGNNQFNCTCRDEQQPRLVLLAEKFQAGDRVRMLAGGHTGTVVESHAGIVTVVLDDACYGRQHVPDNAIEKLP